MPRTFFIFGRFLHTSKIIKNRIPQNTAKNLKSRTLDRPNGDFGMTFGVHLGIDFHEILDFVIICENHRNAYIQSISVSSAHSKPHIFRPKFNQKFILFLMPHSGPHFSTFWRVLMPKCSILGPPWRPAGAPMAPKIAQVAPKSLKKSIRLEHTFADLFPRSLSERSWAPFWSIWDGFWMNFDEFYYHFSMHFRFVCNKICRLPKKSLGEKSCIPGPFLGVYFQKTQTPFFM